MEWMAKPFAEVRSAMAPLTIVAAVAQKPRAQKRLVAPQTAHGKTSGTQKFVRMIRFSQGQGVTHHVPGERANGHDCQVLAQDPLSVL